MLRREKGFTLIELLVVISIIALLSSIVFSVLNTARTNARIANIKSSVVEFRKLMELEYLDNGSYNNLNKGWVGTSSTCSGRGYAGNYASKAIEICNQYISIINNPAQNNFYTGVNTSLGFSNAQDFSIMARLPSGLFFCLGSSGRSTDLGHSSDGWTGTGCYANP